MSGGWISGVCYPALIFTTVILGFRYIFVRVPWQRTYLAIFAAFLGTVGESFIIDTDHWRHFWLMLGAMWGMFAAARSAIMPRTDREITDRLIVRSDIERASGKPLRRFASAALDSTANVSPA